MNSGARINSLFAVLAAAAFGGVWAAVTAVAPADPGLAALAGGGIAAVLIGVIWFAFGRLCAAPARQLVRGMRAVRESSSSDTTLPTVTAPLLGDLAEECDSMATALRSTRREVRKTIQSEAARLDAQKAWLETILQGLNEGVFVCNPQHRIMLYNTAAVNLLGNPEKIGLGRSIGDVLSIAPMRHSLNRLQARHESDNDDPGELSAPFVCKANGDPGGMFHARMALLTDPGGAASGYLVTLIDISDELALLAKGDGVRRALTRDMRGMVGNLRAAAETIATYPAMPTARRDALEGVVLSESKRLSNKLDELGHEIRGHLFGRWPMADIYAIDLLRAVEQNLAGDGLRVMTVGLPLWLHGDSLSLVETIECLVRKLAEHSGEREFEIEPMLGDKRVYFDIVWSGDPVAEGKLETWLDLPCSEDSGGQQIRDVLERHGSEPWSKRTDREGRSVLRLPLLAPHRAQFGAEPKRLPSRPEFYDFGLMRSYQNDDRHASVPLREVPFVVFDCEMTGLQPTQGDEIIQIGAVPILQHRVLTGEGREWLVNPGRPIPPGSIKFHGLTDADVTGKPSIREVLPEFHAYVGDAVMVGHNAAFDMKFLTIKERSAGIEFSNTVLDTMLVSAMLDGGEDDHSLDALCERYGISIVGRHTALGDTIGTAELLLKLIDRLEAKGFKTFGEVMKKTNMAAELRHRGEIFAHGTGG